jgi:hypothetical protein
MTLVNAKKLRDEIRAKGYHCVVPLGFTPRRYFCVIFHAKAGKLVPMYFRSRASFRKHHAQALRNSRRIMRFYHEMQRRTQWETRSPLEFMIDRACGLD